MTDAAFARAFFDYSRGKLVDEYWPRLHACVDSLTDDQTWWRPNESTNSVGNLLLHVNGNVRQWLVTPFAGTSDTRDRPSEFNQRELIPRAALLRALGETIGDAEGVLKSLSAADLQRAMNVQGYATTGFETVYHVVEHFSYHYGQIVCITKQLRARDVGFYAHLNETGYAQ
jgi:uncharacterized damage-inducible protein DinB